MSEPSSDPSLTILAPESPAEFVRLHSSIQVLQMNTLTFGDGPSPCLAIAALRKAGNDYGLAGSEAVETIQNGFYVDDLLDSVPTLEDANEKSKEIDETLRKANFVLRKWLCNKPKFMLEEPRTPKVSTVLGMVWNSIEDCLSLNANAELLKEPKLTMRVLLGKLAGFFSPLGLHSPFVIKAKIRMSQLHLLGLDWDQDLEKKAYALKEDKNQCDRLWEEIQWWQDWCSRIRAVGNVQFPRCLCPFPPNQTRIELHAFGDASEEAMAAAVYIKAKFGEECSITLAMAKTKVAPRKSQSVAKLELSAAVLAARLANCVQDSLRLQVNRRVFWTDSSCVRHWVRATSSFYKPYVANRIGETQVLTKPQEWRHLPGKMNVADEATRSTLSSGGGDLSEQWINGPTFLYKEEESWPQDLELKRITEEIRPKWEFSSFVVKTKMPVRMVLPLDKGNFKRWIRRLAPLAFWLRKSRVRDQSLQIDVPDYDRAEMMLTRMAQGFDFAHEIQSLGRGMEVNKSSKLLSLTPWLDSDGVLRVGGRIGRSELPFDASHPAILHPSNRLTRIIVEHFHQENHHAGVNYVLSKIRQRYWILRGRELVKKVGNECFFCKMKNSQPMTQIMAELPKLRVLVSPPFSNTSVDFFGPIEVQVSRNKSVKRWGAIFACMVTRAVHLEVCPSLSTPDFLNVLRTFCCLRGQPKCIYSDNGTNFVGAEKIMKPVLDQMWSGEKFKSSLAQRGIQWFFQPPSAPHHGGVHEALVKSAKRAIYRVLDESKIKRKLTETELRTVFAEVTGFLNERPLTYTSSDPKDFSPLTPNSFLIQRPNQEIPPGVYKVSSYRGTYEMVQSLVNEIWKRWQEEYLPGLIARAKWRSAKRNLALNDVVLVVEQGLPRNQWLIGRVIEIIPDKYGVVRQARIKTKQRELVRPIVKLCLLEAYCQEDCPVSGRAMAGGKWKDDN